MPEAFFNTDAQNCDGRHDEAQRCATLQRALRCPIYHPFPSAADDTAHDPVPLPPIAPTCIGMKQEQGFSVALAQNKQIVGAGNGVV